MDKSQRKAILYLSDDRSMFFGPFGRVMSQATAASTIVFALEGKIKLLDHISYQSYYNECFLIPAGMRATLDTRNAEIGMIFLDSLGRDLAFLTPHMNEKVTINDKLTFYSGIDMLFIEDMKKVYQKKPNPQEAFDTLNNAIRQYQPIRNFAPDQRVVRAIELIKSNHSVNLSVDSIAKELSLSIPRLIQLFKEVTGVPIRRFRLWHRIYRAALKASEGIPLTEAAISAGFSDYSQFSRTFKEIGGVNPSDVLSARDLVDIKVLPPEMSTVSESLAMSAVS